MKLTYWDLRGLAEPIRYMLRYSELEWEDVRLPVDMEGYQTWMGLKSQPGMVCANLPFIEDGDKKISQTVAILRYVARKTGLMPQDHDDLTLCEMLEQEIMDLRLRLSITCYDTYKVMRPEDEKSEKGCHDFEYLKGVFKKRLKERLAVIDPLFSKGSLTGGFDKLTYADFLAFEMLDQFRTFAPECFDSFDNINNFSKEFANLKGVKEWRGGDAFKAGEYINAPMAVWHGK